MPASKKTSASKVKKNTPATKRFRLSRLQVILAVLLVGIVGSYALVRSFASTGSIYLSPATTNVVQGKPVALSLRINPGGNVDAVQATVTYDPTKLQFVSVSNTGSPFTDTLQQTSTTGSIVLAYSVGIGAASVNTDSLIATLNFTALAGSSSTSVTLSNANATNLGSYTDPSTANAFVDFSAPAPPPDTSAPSVSITSPISGATGTKFNVAATATDNVGVTKMELYVDNKLTTSTSKSSLTYTLSLKGGGKKGSGSATAHTIAIKAYDAAGNVGNNSLTVY